MSELPVPPFYVPANAAAWGSDGHARAGTIYRHGPSTLSDSGHRH